MVLDLALRPLRARHAPARVARVGAEVPHRRELRLGDPPLRLRARLRRDRRARVLGDPAGDGRRRPALRHRHGHDPRRARVQDLGGALSHVDAGRLPGRPDERDRVHGGRHQGRGARRHPADPRHGVPRAERDLDDRRRGARRRLARDRQPRGDRPARREADARLLVRLARRLPADRRRREHRERRHGAPLLPRAVRRRDRRRSSPSSPHASASCDDPSRSRPSRASAGSVPSSVSPCGRSC